MALGAGQTPTRRLAHPPVAGRQPGILAGDRLGRVANQAACEQGYRHAQLPGPAV
ncbi:hypothetical protein OJF2_28310 [Aquisphaera giovannonii]|uniref:Uncharacterized protein n=1 Tax=Aquisphaera giovannonii TaxID=406548 RepID=A0A5B9W147_9BACT|nr:hypothetical protein [Aquisphaera giovannonii]QEH34296.1 hypothetical protein OJF2_28310 [Aquisphaera giovannonii]